MKRMGCAMSGQRPRPPAPQPGRSVGAGAADAGPAQSAGGVNEDRHERARRFLERCQVQIWQGESVEEVFAGINKDGDEKLDADEVLAVFRKLHITMISSDEELHARVLERLQQHDPAEGWASAQNVRSKLEVWMAAAGQPRPAGDCAPQSPAGPGLPATLPATRA